MSFIEQNSIFRDFGDYNDSIFECSTIKNGTIYFASREWQAVLKITPQNEIIHLFSINSFPKEIEIGNNDYICLIFSNDIQIYNTRYEIIYNEKFYEIFNHEIPYQEIFNVIKFIRCTNKYIYILQCRSNKFYFKSYDSEPFAEIVIDQNTSNANFNVCGNYLTLLSFIESTFVINIRNLNDKEYSRKIESQNLGTIPMLYIVKDNLLHVFYGLRELYTINTISPRSISYYVIDLSTNKLIHMQNIIINNISKIKYNYHNDEIILCSKTRYGIIYKTFDTQQKIISKLFAIVVLYTDDYLKKNSNNDIKVNRFLDIVKELPMELQMNICNKAYNSKNKFVRSNTFEQVWRQILN